MYDTADWHDSARKKITGEEGDGIIAPLKGREFGNIQGQPPLQSIYPTEECTYSRLRLIFNDGHLYRVKH